MSHKDYTRFSKPVKEDTPTVTVNEQTEELTTLTPEQHAEQVTTPDQSDTVVEDTKKALYGYVNNCTKLNVRSKPSKYSDILCVLDFMSEVEIIESESTENFYKVCTESGIQGYCVKEYILI